MKAGERTDSCWIRAPHPHGDHRPSAVCSVPTIHRAIDPARFFGLKLFLAVLAGAERKALAGLVPAGGGAELCPRPVRPIILAAMLALVRVPAFAGCSDSLPDAGAGAGGSITVRLGRDRLAANGARRAVGPRCDQSFPLKPQILCPPALEATVAAAGGPIVIRQNPAAALAIVPKINHGA